MTELDDGTFLLTAQDSELNNKSLELGFLFYQGGHIIIFPKRSL